MGQFYFGDSVAKWISFKSALTPMVRQGCRLLLESQNIIVVAEAESGEEAFRYLNDITPDVAVVDLSMENMGGLEVISRMHTRNPETKIIVFSMHDDPFFTQRAFKNGASGYVSKSNPPETLVDAIGHIMKGGQFISQISRKSSRLINTSKPPHTL
ncbi:hypothetical protein AT251_22690 [Enterovibrio nigricans]|nr:response regulator transcription factor [Enterovibrio nigricans]PKF48918.1 hypothetical protein AT251_22690 [Enterovibrio nigricans]